MEESRVYRTAKELLEELDALKISFRGYDKEAVCSYIQMVIRSMEWEKKKELAELIRMTDTLQRDKDTLQREKEALQREKAALAQEVRDCRTRIRELEEGFGNISEHTMLREYLEPKRLTLGRQCADMGKSVLSRWKDEGMRMAGRHVTDRKDRHDGTGI